ncbi:pyrroline-5-carboxylate reductase [Campylobacter pinnipediorum subsp. caledonicus]|uniref:Pyrroline-5-carboxylate reductase n=1 Tax=Campylobacter pinnipediorum subsp. caledonicus TaxID=1874362 RepID=A0A1S6U8E8_9BACT|nr:pyrroline-5-carboxylate reductase [Campylobacter pinnipediorum]AQW88031.1 pyrroline-5-carboxylate reductase [Campylobacter pinnipediorum subsp. caledonicus]
MKIGIIGFGNMGKAITDGINSSNFVKAQDIFVFDKSENKLDGLKELGVNICDDECSVAKVVDILIPAVKPNSYPKLLEKIKPFFDKKSILLSIAAGITIEDIKDILGLDTKVVRAMPNTPASVLRSVTGVCFDENCNENDKKNTIKLLESFGVVYQISQEQMHAFVGISGSLPAYVCMFVDALADGGVFEGLPKDLAIKIAADAVSSSAYMINKTGMHPSVLKDKVCSPNGTTIEAVRSLENGGFRGLVIDAVILASKKSKNINK